MLSKTVRSRAQHDLHEHGNYHNYYAHRTNVIPDARLSLLPPAIFEGKRVLDLGCNAGRIGIESLRYLHASHVVGIDIDPILIAQAQEIVKLQLSPLNLEKRIELRLGDFMQEGYWESFGDEPDVILLLSITKWLHLHQGDAGLITLFQSLYTLLREDGLLIIEPQEWENYRRAVKKAPMLKPVFQSLILRPDFVPQLTEIGFKLVGEKISRTEGGFSRPLYIWRK